MQARRLRHRGARQRATLRRLQLLQQLKRKASTHHGVHCHGAAGDAGTGRAGYARHRDASVGQKHGQFFRPTQAEPDAAGGDHGEGDSLRGGVDAPRGGDVAEEQAQANEIQRAIRQGEILRKKLAGKGAGQDDGVFGELLTPKVDWRKVLRDFVTETCAGRDESSWRKPNRRFLSYDIYMPSMVGTTMTEWVVGFDTSGSIFGGDEMTRFVSEIATIIEQVKPSKVHVIYWDTKVAGHQTFEDGQFAVQDLKIKGGGGTDGSVLFDYLREKNIKPDAIVQFTDGYVGDWGHTDVPTMWAITSDLSAPFGTSIHIDV
jgi:hypothetical protein